MGQALANSFSKNNQQFLSSLPSNLLNKTKTLLLMSSKKHSPPSKPILIDDWSIDFERAFNAKKQIDEILSNTSNQQETVAKTKSDDDEKSETNQESASLKLFALQREILVSNPIGRHLLQHQLCNVFDVDSGEYIYDPKSFDNLFGASDEKVRENETAKSDDDGITNVVVLLSGALNPIHKAHVLALLLGARSIEEQFGIPGNTAWNLTHSAAIQQIPQQQQGTATKTAIGKKSSSASILASHQVQEHDTLTPGKVRVVGCALVPSSDGYVAGKLGKEALKCAVRCQLSEDACVEVTNNYLTKATDYCLKVLDHVKKMMPASAMEKKEKNDDDDGKRTNIPAALPTAESAIRKYLIESENELEHFFPIFTLPYNQASAGLCCQLLKKELDEKYNEDDAGNKKKKPPHKFEVIRLYGSDFAKKYRHYREMVCIERHDKEKSGEYVKDIVENHRDLVGANFIFVPQDPMRDVFGGVADCSSTAVRHALQNEDRQVLSTMLHKEVMEKMILIAKAKASKENELAEEKRKKEEMIAFHRSRKANESEETKKIAGAGKKQVKFSDEDDA